MLTVLLLSLLALTGCGSGEDADAGARDSGDSGETAYNLAKIVLEENPSTGYAWTVEQVTADGETELLIITDEYEDAASSESLEDQTDAETSDAQSDSLDGEAVVEGELGMVGAAGMHTYWLAVSPDGPDAVAENEDGKAVVTVKFSYARSWEDTVLYTVEYDFSLDADGNLNFLEKRTDAMDESAAESMPDFPDPEMSMKER